MKSKDLSFLCPRGYKLDTNLVGGLLGIKPKRLARIMNGTAKNVLIEELSKIAAFFHVNIKELL